MSALHKYTQTQLKRGSISKSKRSFSQETLKSGSGSTSTSNGILLRRNSRNLGDEDTFSDPEDPEGTLLRRPVIRKTKVNGTAEKSSNSGEKAEIFGKILEKSRASLSRSKSELGEQHKKMISHLTRGKTEISETNKKLLANLSKKLKNKSADAPTSADVTGRAAPADDNNIDGLMKNLGILENNDNDNDNKGLELKLENDYGEFEFIDEGGTLTRTLKTNGESLAEHRKSMFSFSEEVFDELEKAGTLKNTAEKPKDQVYETYGAWRQRKLSSSSNFGATNSSSCSKTTGYVSQYYYHYNNNNSCTSNTSAKLSALIADQTLLLRHHKRRQQQQQTQQQPVQIWRENSKTKAEEEREEQLQSLMELQAQLAAATKEHLEGSSLAVNFSQQPLRRCSSLSQTEIEDDHDHDPPAKINGSSSKQPWLSTNNARYLYRGKFQPAPAAQNNNAQAPPWQLRGNLSSFARRRRGSSTSLHSTFSDNEEENSNNSVLNAKCKGDSVSLADAAETMSLNHR